MGLYINEVMEKYKDYVVTVNMPSMIGGSIDGFITEDTFELGTGAEWGPSSITGSYKDALKGFTAKFAGRIPILGKMAQDFISSTKTVNNTINLYESPSDISISFTMNIIQGVNNGSKSYSDLELMLNKLTQPDLDGSEGALLPYMYSLEDLAPLQTGSYSGLDAKMASISIGDWFTADKLRINNATRAYSTILNEQGKPLFMSLQITASPYRALSAEEVTKWIKV